MKRTIRRTKWQWILMGVLLVAGGATSAWAQTNAFPSSGNVGIGTSNPLSTVDVRQPSDDPLGGLRVLNSAGTLGIYLWVDDSDVSRLAGGRDGSGRLSINAGGGNVGIGTANPITKLDLRQSSDTPLNGIRILNSTVERSLFLWVDSSDVGRLDSGLDGSGSLSINAGGGNVGIGTASPATKLVVYDPVQSAVLRVGRNDSNYLYATWHMGQYGMINAVTGDAVGTLVLNRDGGNVGIGTVPSTRLHVAGDAQVDGNIAAKYQDIAEWVSTPSPLPPGTVVMIDPLEGNRVLPASRPYDTRVAGVVSSRPGLLLGEEGEDKAKVAHSGRVKVKVDAQYGPIAAGDLLVASPTPGHAMRSTPVDLGGAAIHRPGTLLGKALEPLGEGRGEILVLLTLQ